MNLLFRGDQNYLRSADFSLIRASPLCDLELSTCTQQGLSGAKI